MLSPPAVQAPSLKSLALDDLIDLYFETDHPAERDAVLAQLSARQGPRVDAFLVALIAHDDDIFLRLAAAAELVERGYAQARSVLTDTLLEAGDDEVLEEAIDAWVRVAGAEGFAQLAQLFESAERDTGERLLAMSGMERADGARAVAAFVAELERVPGERGLDGALLEAMLGCFVRERAGAGRDALHACLQRMIVGEDDEQRRELAAAIAVLDEAEAEATLEAASGLGAG